MLIKFSHWLGQKSTGWLALVSLAVFILFMLFILPAQSAQARQTSGGAESPDTSFWYSPADLYRMAEAYGVEGRAAYIHARLTFDVVWPLAYGFFLTVCIAWVYKKAFQAGSRWQIANLAPLLGLLLDYLENLSTVLVMGRFPAQSPGIDALAPVFTLLKWTFVNGSFVLLLLGLMVWGIRRLRAR